MTPRHEIELTYRGPLTRADDEAITAALESFPFDLFTLAKIATRLGGVTVRGRSNPTDGLASRPTSELTDGEADTITRVMGGGL